jgi:hypothetical protein
VAQVSVNGALSPVTRAPPPVAPGAPRLIAPQVILP